MMRVRYTRLSPLSGRAVFLGSRRPAAQRDEFEAPDFVPDEWTARYAADPGRARLSPARDRAARDAWLIAGALALCAAVFGAAVIWWALSAVMSGWLAAIIAFAVVFAGSLVMARMVVSPQTTQPGARRGPIVHHAGRRCIYRHRPV